VEPAAAPVSVVIASRDRRGDLLHTIERLAALPERPPIIYVDNGSTDGSPRAVRAAFPDVDVVELGINRGAAARNIGVERATTPVVAFSDDDSWWEAGSLALAAEVFEHHPRLGLIEARILVGPGGREDATCADMAASRLPPDPNLPGPPVLGFISCGAIVRREAFLQVGGFDEVVFFLGEEERVAVDLAAAGWGLAYVHRIVARHHPSASRTSPDERRRLQLRNYLLSQWMRRPALVALRKTLAVASAGDPVSRGALFDALRRLAPALRARRVLPEEVESRLRLLEGGM
jgi:GT2 family glycosyltransferase